MQSTEREYLLLALHNAKSKLSVARSSDPQKEEQWRESAGEIPGRRNCEIGWQEGSRSVTEVPVILRPWSGGNRSLREAKKKLKIRERHACAIELELQSPNPNPPRAPTIAFMRAGLPSSLQTWRPYHRARWSALGNLRCPFHLSHTLIIIFIPRPHSLGRSLIFPPPPLTSLPLSFFHPATVFHYFIYIYIYMYMHIHVYV